MTTPSSTKPPLRPRTSGMAWRDRLIRPFAAAFLAACAGMLPAMGNDTTPPATCPDDPSVMVLLYHRLSNDTPGSTTVRFDNLLAQMAFFRHQGYEFRPLREVVAWRLGKSIKLPRRTVALTVDDDNRSTFDILLPVAKANRIPVTLFIYPSAISNASYALTWDQLRLLHQTGLFDVQSHTLWHPNFDVERRRLGPAGFRAFALAQLGRSKAIIETHVGAPVDLIAWPFGMHDDELELLAAQAGYVAGFGIDERRLQQGDPAFAMPRITMPDIGDETRLALLLSGLECARAASGRGL